MILPLSGRTPLTAFPEYHSLFFASRPPLPEKVNIGLSSACTLRCTMCAHAVPGRVPTVELTQRAWDHMQDALQGCHEITIAGTGDPLLHPRFPAHLRQVGAYGKLVTIYTSMNFWREDYTDAVVENVTDLYCSTDAATPETYARIRVGGSFDKVRQNITRVVQRRREAGIGAERLKLSLGFIAMDQNLHEMPLAAELAARLGMDALMLQPLFENVRLDQSVLAPDHLPRLRDAIERTRAACHRLGIELHNTIRYVESKGCTTAEPQWAAAAERTDNPGADLEMFAWEQPADEPAVLECTDSLRRVMIYADGTVIPCWDRYHPMGNLNEETFDEVWTGERFRHFRRRMQQPGDSPCRGCIQQRWVVEPHLEGLPDHVLAEEMGNLQRVQGFWWLERDSHGRPFRWTHPRCTLFFRTPEHGGRLEISGELDERVLKLWDGEPLRISYQSYTRLVHPSCAGPLHAGFVLGGKGEHGPLLRVDVTAPRAWNPRRHSRIARDNRELGFLFREARLGPLTV